MLRTLSYTTRVVAAAAALALPATLIGQENRPVVVVFTFTNSSIGPARAEFDGMIAEFPRWMDPENGVIKAMVAVE